MARRPPSRPRCRLCCHRPRPTKRGRLRRGKLMWHSGGEGMPPPVSATASPTTTAAGAFVASAGVSQLLRAVAPTGRCAYARAPSDDTVSDARAWTHGVCVRLHRAVPSRDQSAQGRPRTRARESPSGNAAPPQPKLIQIGLANRQDPVHLRAAPRSGAALTLSTPHVDRSTTNAYDIL